MLADFITNPLLGLTEFVLLIVALTFHEFAHAKVADSLGDPTPRLQKRITLNPLAHLDPVGTALLLIVGFGWGRPVQFDPYNLENPRRDAMKIAFAGPLTNILMALATALVLRVIDVIGFVNIGVFATQIATFFVIMNLSLAVFNLIPIEPLDGFKVVGGLLSEEQAEKWYSLAPYGPLLLIALIMPIWGSFSPLLLIIRPVVSLLAGIIL
jgi:Zn-dependent protease